MLCHLIAFSAGFILDLLFGDPHWLPHPVRLIGSFISFLDKKLNRPGTKGNCVRGTLTAVIVCSTACLICGILLIQLYYFSIIAGIVTEALLTYYLLAAKCLKVESMKVYKALKSGNIEESRRAVSMIVGRDTENLTEEQIAKAAVETVAENTSDGEIAPMIYLALGGPVLGFFYKAVNTMDSMIGYKNQRYLEFGRTAAKTDDVLNFLPSRISAWLMIFSCLFLGKNFSFKNARKIFRRDRFNHASPNSAQTESACAGALGLQLAGPAYYEGHLEEKPFIGDNLRPIVPEDIKRANRLLYATTFLCAGLCIVAILLYELIKH